MSAQDSLISELEDAISHGNDERRAKTLRRVTDLFVFGSGHFSQDHIALFDGVFNHLIAHIEESARTMLANQLAPIVNAPPKAIRALAFDDAIMVAGPVLKQSPQLDNAALVSIHFLRGLKTAKLNRRLPARFFRRHARANVVFDLHLDVRLEFSCEFVLARVAKQIQQPP